VLAALAVAVHVGRGGTAMMCTVAGFFLALATVVITAALNVPLNDALAAAGDPDGIVDLAGVWAAFLDAWPRWNGVRTATSTAALGRIAWALRSGVA
jgi:uncharacterized membrane protein